MAKEVDHKLAVAERLYDFACNKHGLPPSDLLFDPLTFTICTGNADDRKLGLNTLDAIERIRDRMPECQIILVLSNISFGLNPPARQVLNSVFLDHALRRGLTGAIVHFSKIQPLHRIPEEEVRIAEDLIFDRRREGYDPLQAFMALFQDRTIEKAEKKGRPEKLEDRLAQRIVDGDRQDLEADLELAMQSYPPLDIINNILLSGMKTVGDLFGAGQMQLPFVLQSAETMKAAVGYLEPFMERIEGQEKGIVVLATVRGDVHDIGKNLVDIILTNNGYRVVNLGIKQPGDSIIHAAQEHRADAIGLSGLLVKSTLEMKYVIQDLERQKLEFPVICGGAALTRKYVEDDLRRVYSNAVFYSDDAFGGLHIMEDLTAPNGNKEARLNEGRTVKEYAKAVAVDEETGPVFAERSPVVGDAPNIPAPPFWGVRVKKDYDLRELFPYINDTALFKNQWQLKTASQEDYAGLVERKYRPIKKELEEEIIASGLFEPKVVWGYFPAQGDGNDVVVYKVPDPAALAEQSSAGPFDSAQGRLTRAAVPTRAVV